jgi:Tol biopolymer transport system component
MTQISVDSIKIRHEALTEKVNQAASSKEVIKDVKAFIIEIRAAGAMTPPGNKRELLRSLADAWGNYVYRETGVFPPTDLDAYAGPERHMLMLPSWIASLSRPVQIILLVGVILAVMAVSSLIGSLTSSGSERATLTAQAVEIEAAAKTLDVYQVEQTTIALAATNIALTPELPTDTPSPTETPSPTLSPTETPTPTAESIEAYPDASLGRLVELTSLKGGESVTPEMTLSGVYENLPPGFSWSIHILLEPLSNVGTLYPLEPYFVVPDGETSGQWDLDVRFDIGTGFAVEERFLLSLVVAQDDGVRNALKVAVGRGLTELPPKAFSSLGVTTVTRKAYALINEERLIYASYLNETNNSEILVAKLDGSDVQQIPNPYRSVSLQPSISPNGEKIAYVGQERSGDEIFYLLVLMDSNGNNRNIILRQKGIIERPVWFKDGNFIAYSAIPPSLSQSNDRSNVFNLFVYDVENDVPYQLTYGEPSYRYPAWMPDGKQLVFSARTIKTSTFGLITIDIETGDQTILVDMLVLDEEQPAVSPDGNLIAYSASNSTDPADNSDIYIYDTRDDKITKLTGLNGDDGHDVWPAWSADGQTIYFQSHRLGKGNTSPNIWAIDIDGSNLRQITFGLESDVAPFVGVLKAYWLIQE